MELVGKNPTNDIIRTTVSIEIENSLMLFLSGLGYCPSL